MPVVPWAAVAAPLMTSSEQGEPLVGQAFCFLPLPGRTGLPVHVNAYFELSTNRRGIWHGDDMAGAGQLRSDWNLCLLKDVVAPTYRMVLRELAELIGPGAGYYAAWPTMVPPAPWGHVVRQLYTSMAGQPAVHSSVGGGRWLAPESALYLDEPCQRNEGLVEALLHIGLPVLDAPPPVCRLLLEHTVAAHSMQLLGPAWLRAHIRGAVHTVRDACTAAVPHAGPLLSYCLEDVDDEAPEAAALLHGLPLVPLASSGLGTLQASEQAR
eukprot:jgi/Botrbrau1/6888/Bobra.67_3s0007.1